MALFRALVIMVRTILDNVLEFFFGLYWESKRKPIPALAPEHRILSLSAVTLAQKIRDKELKSEELVRCCIERLTIINPILNSVIDERYDEALEEAREVDMIIQNGVPEEYFKQRPFLGVPFTTKELNAVNGLLHTLGVSARRNVRATYDAECVRRLKAAGAIPVAVTNVPEVGMWMETRNMIFGQTNNPHHTGRTPGGSSGGEGANTAAFGSCIAVCSDLAGSTRMPAFYCGLFGLNPTPGHTNMKGCSLSSGQEKTMSSLGFVSKHVEDQAPLLKIITGEKAPLLNLDRTVNAKDLKVFYVDSIQDPWVSPMSAEIKDNIKNVVSKLSESASSTDMAPARYHHEGFDHIYLLFKNKLDQRPSNLSLFTDGKYVPNLWAEVPKKLLGLSEHTMAGLIWMMLFPKVDRQWADALLKTLRDDLLRVLGDTGVLLFPSAAHTAPYHYLLLLRTFNFAYTGIFNALGFPSLQVPLGLNSAGVPLGVQVVAGPRQEALCLAMGERLSTMFGGFKAPCKVM